FPIRSREFWARALDRLAKHPTPQGLPKFGYVMEGDEGLVGVVLLVSSCSHTDQRCTTRCNLSSWYVKPAYRSYAALFSRHILKQKDITYLNISAAKHTLGTIQAQ